MSSDRSSQPSQAAPRASPPLIIQPRRPESDLPAEPPPHILVVDGDSVVGARLARWLHQRGYAVALACDVGEAVAMLQIATFDLIIADIDLIGPTGPQWIEELFRRGGFPPVILTPSTLTLQKAAHAANLPLAGYLPKPVDHDALRAILTRRFGPSYR